MNLWPPRKHLDPRRLDRRPKDSPVKGRWSARREGWHRPINKMPWKLTSFPVATFLFTSVVLEIKLDDLDLPNIRNLSVLPKIWEIQDVPRRPHWTGITNCNPSRWMPPLWLPVTGRTPTQRTHGLMYEIYTIFNLHLDLYLDLHHMISLYQIMINSIILEIL